MSATSVRPLKNADLSRVVEIDQQSGGTSRKGYFEKRLAAHLADPDNYLSIGAEQGGKLIGFLLAHIQNGEFGAEKIIAVLDAIGVDPGTQRSGVGHQLLAQMKSDMKQRGAVEIQSQADWGVTAMLDFFSREGFRLAPKLVLERDTDNVNF